MTFSLLVSIPSPLYSITLVSLSFPLGLVSATRLRRLGSISAAMSSYLIGKKIVLKSNSEIRYTGTLHAIDTNTNSISLVNVLSLGTEDRVTGQGYVPPAETLYPYVVFR